MMRYSVIAARDGDTYHDEVFADTQEEAERLAREELAEAWNLQEALKEALDAGDPTIFDADTDGFSVTPDPDPIEIVAMVFRDAKDAPTSFEDEEWLEGFESGRQMIAERVALHLSKAGIVGFDELQFRKACDLTLDPGEEDPS
jgi:hypothetical protein